MSPRSSTRRRMGLLRKRTLQFVKGARQLGRRTKQLIMICTDALALPAALWTAIALRADGSSTASAAVHWPYAAIVMLTVPVFARIGLYRAAIRYLGVQAGLTILLGAGISAVMLATAAALYPVEYLTIEVYIIYFALATLYVGATRMLAREMLRMRSTYSDRVIIYGAGAAGAQLCTALRARGQYQPVAIIDDNKQVRNMRILGLRVYSSDRLVEVSRRTGARIVLLAMPSAKRRARIEIIDRLTQLGFKVQTVPDVSDIVSGRSRIEEMRDIEVNDLLGRDPVPPNVALLSACVRGKSILVTGAGGSIGSELCRQIMELVPRRLVLLEVSELALYEIERELRAVNEGNGNRIELVPLLGNAHHKHRVREIMTTFGIQTVYHAAAYKHVPIVECNMVEGIHNNVFATYYTAEAVLECRVEAFVLVSTDKAVNPSNVMGCTKRVAEMVLQGLQQRAHGTRFCMVRFGNVLESSGSVVPLFREQIRAGGPVTVTHPDVIRYFMTILEAAQLVIQAGSMGSGGDVFVLDMGSPVRIADLAKRMIQLAGYTVRDEKNPDGDVEVRFTGLRPAEKLFEELLIGKNVTGTEHPRILRAMEHSLPWDQMKQVLDELASCAARFDCERAREVLMRAVPEYTPADKVQDHVWLHNGTRVSGAILADDDKVREIRPRAPA